MVCSFMLHPQVSHRDNEGCFIDPTTTTTTTTVNPDDLRPEGERAPVEEEGVLASRGEGDSKNGEERSSGGDDVIAQSERGVSAEEESDVVEANHMVTSRGEDNRAGGPVLEFAREELQEYVLMCSQQPDGGLRDKPGK